MPQDSHSEWDEGRVFCDSFMREVALEIVLKDRWGFTLETIGDDVSQERKHESKDVDLRCVQEAAGKRLRLHSCSSSNVS